MRLLRQYGLTLVILAAIILSFGYTLAESHAETAQIRKKAIEVCTHNSNAQALIVAFKLRVAREYKKEGEEQTGRYTARLARSGLELIPLPAGSTQAVRNNLTRVQPEGGHFILRPEAIKLMRRGCAEAYNPD